ncbi:hypothetical protein SI65_08246 [Aspergillus cristatus]|uniref:Very-long-chain 3-oxoacyl-CoA reductase n=1 Tax=Aspergillus cristatus TaxID=573508 RepID=A0A1E3B5L9_ASPCR|nr:hypothetical protein SI65_08246 [Aspergillus cristatus]
MSISSAFCYVGAATTCYWTIQLARYLYCCIRPSSLPRYNPTGKDAWALVTGATGGIGFGFAEELSERGFNVFLHGRNREKLSRRQEELQAKFPNIKYKIIVSDAADIYEDVNLIPNEIGDAKLTVLVNNVGGETQAYRGLTELSYQDVRTTINTNATFMTQITRVLLPVLEKNGPSLILNISSIAAYGMPFVPVYSGTKGFVESFSRALDAEVKARGQDVEVLAIRVGSVRSQSNDVDVGLLVPDSRTMAAASLERVGCGLPLIFGYWGHAIAGVSLDFSPRSFMIKMLANTMDSLKKQAEERQAKRN